MREMGSGTLPCSVIPSLPPIVPAWKTGASPNPGLPTALPKPCYQDPKTQHFTHSTSSSAPSSPLHKSWDLSPSMPPTPKKAPWRTESLKPPGAGGTGRGPKKQGGAGYLRRMISEAPLLYMRKPPLPFFSTVLMDLRTELKV